jgi:hypothetical protein
LSLTLVVLLLGALPQRGVADPFVDGELFAGRSMVQSARDRGFFAGAKVQAAPVRAVVQSVVRSQVDKYAAQYPETKQVIGALDYVDTDQIRQLADSGQVEQFKQLVQAQMAARGVTMTPEQQQALNQVDSTKLNQLAMVADALKTYNQPEPTTTFALEPYAGFTAGPLQLTAQVPLAGFYNSRSTTLVVGNPGIDLRLGKAFGHSQASLGFVVGGSVWAPLGSVDSDTIALSNVLAAPRYLHDYLSVTGYGLVAAELGIFDLTLRGEYVEMRPYSDKNKDLNLFNDVRMMRYVHAGAGVLADVGVAGLSVELDSLFNLANAQDLHHTVLLTAGARLYLRKVLVGVAVQTPLSAAEDSDGAGTMLGGVRLGAPADVNVLVNAQFSL